MAQRFSRKQLKHDEFVEAAFDIGHWVEQHWKNVALAAGAIVALVLVVWGWTWMADQRRAEVERTLASGIALYEQAEETAFVDVDKLAGALTALEEVSAQSGPAANVARYYRAATLRQLGRTDDAIAALDGIEDLATLGTLGGVAQLLRAHLYVEAGRADEALTLLGELAQRQDGVLPADQALLELAQIQFERGELEQARETWQRVVDEYPDRSSSAEARSRLDAPAD